MKRPFRLLGLVRARSYDALVEQQKKCEARAGRLAKHLVDAKANSRLWKAKADEVGGVLKKAQDAAESAQLEWRRAEKRREEQTRRAEKLSEEADKHRKEEQARTADMAALKQRLEDSERELNVAREQLMAVEVKLDILEGAANVLDARTRDVVARRSSIGTESGTAV